MTIKKLNIRAFLTCIALAASFSASATCTVGTDPLLCETREVIYSGNASVVATKAAELGSPVKIYEYLRNNAEYAMYQGARSNSHNALIGLRGNDVDLASGLIAMLRSQGIRARYVNGEIFLSNDQLYKLTGIPQPNIATLNMLNLGLDVDQYLDGVIFRHTWVEALLAFDNYRGVGQSLADSATCTAETSDKCKWISLDPSYKQKSFIGGAGTYNLLTNAVFDYTTFWDALRPGSTIKDKAPLEVYEEQVLSWLRTNQPGVSLDKVLDVGTIVKEESGILPASLPYAIATPTSVQRFNSIDDYDVWAAAQSPALDKWKAQVNITFKLSDCATKTWVGGSAYLSDISTKRLSIMREKISGTDYMVTRLGGVNINQVMSGTSLSVPAACGTTHTFSDTTPIDILLDIDGRPGDLVHVEYTNEVAGGAFVVAIGGENSNWGQVELAYKSLLAANTQYPIVIKASDSQPYVDNDHSGAYTTGDTLLIDDDAAMNALTIGLMEAAQRFYYARFRERSERVQQLHRVTTPIITYGGIVTAVHSVSYLSDAPFAIMPGGLLIDLKGNVLGGSWKIDSATPTYSNETFKLLGLIASSLEHEVWQELTNFDAISTVKGLQLARKANNTIVSIVKNNSTNTLNTTAYTALGFKVDDTTAPTGFTKRERTQFSTQPVTWTVPVDAKWHDMFIMKKTVSSSDSATRKKYKFFSNIDNSASAEGWLKCVDDVRTALQSGIDAGQGNYIVPQNWSWCDTSYPAQGHTVTVAMNTDLPYYYANTVVPAINTLYLGETDYFQYFNKLATTGNGNQGFVPANYVYRLTCFDSPCRDVNAPADYITDGFMLNLRDELYLNSTNKWYEYTLPSRLISTPQGLFNVYIKHERDITTGDFDVSTYAISNTSFSGGGGYVTGTAPLTQYGADSGYYDNSYFSNKVMNGLSNNNTVMTPSTADPVSTTTGNMYHDETDFTINGKGVDITFTRTYNSGPTATSGGATINPNNLPLSKGWTHSYNMKLVSNDYGKYPNYTSAQAPENGNNKVSSITYVDERGGEVNFLLNDASTTSQPTAPTGVFDKLTINDTAYGGAGFHSLKFRNGTVYVFQGVTASAVGANMRTVNHVARLYRIVTPQDQQLNFDYTAANTSGKLFHITDNTGVSGRTVTFAYNATSGRLETITDWTSRVWTYGYDSTTSTGRLTSVANPLGEQMNYNYVGNTHLLKDVIYPQDRGGLRKTTTFSYYSNQKAFNYVDKLGQEEALAYDFYRKRTRITHPDGTSTEHFYDDKGALTKLIQSDGSQLLFENNTTDGLRYKKYDAKGRATVYSYKADRSLTGAVSDVNGLVTREQNALAQNTDYDYTKNTAGYTTAYGIDDQITKIVDKRGNQRLYQYYTATNAGTGAVIGKLQTESLDKLTYNGTVYTNVKLRDYQYNTDGTLKQLIEYLDPSNISHKRTSVYTYTYTTNGYTVDVVTTGNTEGTSITRQQQYDSLWRLKNETVLRRTSATNATMLSLVTQYNYDNLSRVKEVVDPAGNIRETVYDKNGKVEKIIVHNKLDSGNVQTALPSGCVSNLKSGYHSCTVISNVYDLVDQLKSETDVLGNVTQYKYDKVGNVVDRIDANNHTLHYEYDSLKQRTAVVNENGYRVDTVYDATGNVVSVKDGNGNITQYEYDALGRKTAEISPMGYRTVIDLYDANGNIVKMRDANAQAGLQTTNTYSATVYNEYDELNRVVKTVDAENGATQYRYDLLGNTVSIIDAEGHQTQFVYDDLGRQKEIIDPIVETPADKKVIMTYDEASNLLTSTDRNGEVSNFTYDKLNRLTRVDYLADSSADQINYDQFGNKVSISNPGVTYTYTYDAKGRMLSKTDSRNNKSLAWTYDNVGNVLSKTDYQGKVSHYVYDSTNRVVSMQNSGYLQATYQYDGAGRLKSRILSNGASTIYTYDDDNRLEMMLQNAADGSLVQQTEYEHDRLGNITKITYGGLSTQAINYTYYPTYRLHTVDDYNNTQDANYTYDKVGNRLTQTLGGTTTYYKYNNSGNRLDKVCLDVGCTTGNQVNSYVYDDNGSRTAKYSSDAAGSTPYVLESYTYNQRRLITALTNGSGNSTFTYDPNAYRIEKVTPWFTNRYYLEAEHLEAVYDENNVLKASYLRGAVIDEIINGFDDNGSGLQNQTYHHDHVNSVTAVTDHQGDLLQQVTYAPFGEVVGGNSYTSNRLAYTGRELDDWYTYYYRARYYDPSIGRFMSEDPKGFAAGVNFYAYVNNNPLNANDPSGQFAFYEHAYIGYQAARENGYSIVDSVKVGFWDAAHDWGTQGIEDANVHSMSQPGQTQHQAEMGAAAEIQKNLDLGTLKGLGYALHTNDDSFAAGHAGYQSYSGLKDLPGSHYVNDWIPCCGSVKNAIWSASELIHNNTPSPFSGVYRK